MKTSPTSSAITIGPWHVGDNGVSVLTGDGIEIARTFSADTCLDLSPFEARRNARLIAAAPFLLEACRTQLENWHDLQSGEWDGNSEGIQAAIAELKNAISRAA